MANRKKIASKSKTKVSKYTKLMNVASKELADKKKALVKAEKALATATKNHQELVQETARLDMLERSLKALVEGSEPPQNVRYVYTYPLWVYPPQPWLYGQYQHTYPQIPYPGSSGGTYGGTGVYINGGNGSWQGSYTNSNLPIGGITCNTITCNSSAPVTCNSGALVGSSGTAFIGNLTAGPNLGETGIVSALSSVGLTPTTSSIATTITVDLSTGAEADDGPVKINELPEAIACQKGVKDWAPVD